jgi:hypothetical protein
MVVNGTLDLERVRAAGQALLAPILDRIFSAGFLLELAAIIAAGLIAYWLAPRLVRFFKQHVPRTPPRPAVDRGSGIGRGPDPVAAGSLAGCGIRTRHRP